MSQDIALQNIQARLRMVLSFFFAQLTPTTYGPRNGFLLVLGTANIAEGLRGYLTKYDCSSADINPIGGINKSDLKAFLSWFSTQIDLPVLREIAEAKPSAELRPFDPKESYSTQLDEEDMGMTYEELDEFGRLRKIERAGPLSMFEHLLLKWGAASPKKLTPRQIADKVKLFFKHYAQNRHKTTVLTPSYHCENYGTDDNRFDLRQFLYDASWEVQFKQIELVVELMESKPKL